MAAGAQENPAIHRPQIPRENLVTLIPGVHNRNDDSNFLAAQRDTLDHFAKQAQIVSSGWSGQIETLRHFKD
jgi:hypothetical protein